MEKGFIEVIRISKQQKKVDDNTGVKNPITKKEIPDYSTKIENISISGIKSFRNWIKNPMEEMAFKGGLTLIYFYSPNKSIKKDKNGEDKTNPPEMLIYESVESFRERLGTITLPDELREKVMG